MFNCFTISSNLKGVQRMILCLFGSVGDLVAHLCLDYFLKLGYVLGNPVTCEEMDINNRVPYANRIGLISDKLYEAAKVDCRGDYINVDPNNAACRIDLQNVSKGLERIRLNHILEPICNILSPRGKKLEWRRSLLEEEYNFNVLSTFKESGLKFWCRSYNYVYGYIWANDKTVRKALNIREGTKENWDRCNESLAYTKDIKCNWDYHRNLTRKPYRALIYSGDHDALIPYVATYKWIQALNLSLSSSAEWIPWYVDGQTAGYSTLYTSEKDFDLTFTTIKGGGHTAPEYKPKECFAMIERWLCLLPDLTKHPGWGGALAVVGVVSIVRSLFIYVLLGKFL